MFELSQSQLQFLWFFAKLTVPLGAGWCAYRLLRDCNPRLRVATWRTIALASILTLLATGLPPLSQLSVSWRAPTAETSQTPEFIATTSLILEVAQPSSLSSNVNASESMDTGVPSATPTVAWTLDHTMTDFASAATLIDHTHTSISSSALTTADETRRSSIVLVCWIVYASVLIYLVLV